MIRHPGLLQHGHHLSDGAGSTPSITANDGARPLKPAPAAI